MYPLSHVSTLFKIDAATLYRWCRRAGIVSRVDPIDMRRRYLSDSQLILLSQLHHRVIVIDADKVQVSELQRLEARIAELEKERRLD
jgi:hypothetical protein